MKKLIFLIVNIAIYAWQLKGITYPININSTNNYNNMIWAFQNGQWKTNLLNTKYPILTNIEGGEGFWVYNTYNISNNYKKDTYEWREGWNLVTPVFEKWNMNNKFKGNIPFAWKYQNNKWYLYSPTFTYKNTFNILNIGEAAWVYIPSIDIKMNNTPIFCKDGNCSTLYTTDTAYNIYLKTDTYNTDLKFAFDLYRYSNNTHYKLAFGPFQIDSNGIKTNIIPVCVQKEGVGGSCKKIDNSKDTFLTYSNHYIKINSQKIASLFNKSIPNTKETFLMKIYISGFNVNGFKNDKDFGTLGIEGFGGVSVTNDKSIEFEMEIK